MLPTDFLDIYWPRMWRGLTVFVILPMIRAARGSRKFPGVALPPKNMGIHRIIITGVQWDSCSLFSAAASFQLDAEDTEQRVQSFILHWKLQCPFCISLPSYWSQLVLRISYDRFYQCECLVSIWKWWEQLTAILHQIIPGSKLRLRFSGTR